MLGPGDLWFPGWCSVQGQRWARSVVVTLPICLSFQVTQTQSPSQRQKPELDHCPTASPAPPHQIYITHNNPALTGRSTGNGTPLGPGSSREVLVGKEMVFKVSL